MSLIHRRFGQNFRRESSSVIHNQKNASGEVEEDYAWVFTVTGLKVGRAAIYATGKDSAGRDIAAREHWLQVYAPLALRPRLVTILTESVFQVKSLWI